MTLERIGRYEVERELGRGAMAVVYKAVDPVIGRVVAIKTIRVEHGVGMERDELRKRLYREAQSAGQLNHPGIVTIYDFGEEGDLTYIAMEFIEGQTLESWLHEHPIPPLAQTISIIEQIAAGLDFAAVRGIIHRDIKPGNILLTSDLRAKIADFGIAKLAMSNMTQTGMVMGTPSYMSPEQAMGRDLDGRSDLFSLGIIFYQMLTGERPFVGTNATTIIYKILHEEPVPPRKLNVTLHASFDTIIPRMLAKDPDQRYQTCRDFMQDLKNYTTLGGTLKMPAPPAAAAAATAVQPAAPAPALSRKRSSYAIASAFVLLIGVIAVLGYFLYMQQQRALERERPRTEQLSPPAPAGSGARDTAGKAAPSGPTAGGGTPLAADGAARSDPGPTPGAAKADGKGAPGDAARDVAKGKTAGAAVDTPPDKAARGQVRVQYPGQPYDAVLFDGARKLQDLGENGAAIAVSPGDHRFRIVSEEVYLDRPLERVRLQGGEVFTLAMPGLGSAYIEVPNDAYDGCEILLNGKSVPTPYPALITRLAAGSQRVQFRWSAGKYNAKELASTVTIQEGHHVLIKGDPQADKVTSQQVR